MHDESCDTLFTSAARDELEASVDELIAALHQFKRAVSGLADPDDAEQLQACADAQAHVGEALWRADAAEDEWSGTSSFWPTDPDAFGREGDGTDDGGAAAEDTDSAVLMLRLDLAITDPEALAEAANDERDGGYEASDVVAALQALLPCTVGVVEQSVADFADVTWAFAGVSGSEWPVPDEPETLDRDEIFGATDDPDLRAFYMMHLG